MPVFDWEAPVFDWKVPVFVWKMPVFVWKLPVFGREVGERGRTVRLRAGWGGLSGAERGVLQPARAPAAPGCEGARKASKSAGLGHGAALSAKGIYSIKIKSRVV